MVVEFRAARHLLVWWTGRQHASAESNRSSPSAQRVSRETLVRRSRLTRATFGRRATCDVRTQFASATEYAWGATTSSPSVGSVSIESPKGALVMIQFDTAEMHRLMSPR